MRNNYKYVKKSPKSDIKFEASSFLHVFLEEQSYLFIQESSLTFLLIFDCRFALDVSLYV